MKGKMTILRVNGAVEVKELTRKVGLDPLQDAVGGYIETVPRFDKYEGERCITFCNEEGKLEGLAVNARATKLWADQGVTHDILLGDIVILTGDEEFLSNV